jgi:hypothetical protein
MRVRSLRLELTIEFSPSEFLLSLAGITIRDGRLRIRRDRDEDHIDRTLIRLNQLLLRIASSS